MNEHVYILLFRGINVGGNKIVKMETLRKALTDSGFGGVASYIQSGNVVLTSDKDEAGVEVIVEKVFVEVFGFTSRPTALSLETWQRLVDENPFAGATDVGKRVHAVILAGSPKAEAVESLRALAATEQIELKDGVLYLHTPNGFGTSKVSAALDKVLKVPLTARNWNTVLKLQEMAEALHRM